MDMYEKYSNKDAVICIIGLGYVGLPTAVNFAEKGFTVIGAEKNIQVVDLINNGSCHLKDLNLDDRVKKVVQDTKLIATTDTTDATRKSDVIIIIVPTPIKHDKTPDLQYIKSAGEDISKGLDKNKLVILESTVYPGVTEDVLNPILEMTGLKSGQDYGLAYCPERYNPGDREHTIENIVRLVGAITPEWRDLTQQLYKNIVKDVFPVKDIKTAEAAKVIENIQRDLNIALMNELALIFSKMNIDIMDVIEAASTKWNFNVYYPGAGVGGHCLPVDPYYLVKKAEELGYHSKVITAGRAINDYMPIYVFELLVDALNECERPVKNSKIVVLGFSYKENVGDPREAPAKYLIEELKKKKANVHIVDPYIEKVYLSEYGTVDEDIYSALDSADALVLMTGHDKFRDLDLEIVYRIMNVPIIIDGRRFFDRNKLIEHKFNYKGIGVANSK